MALHITRLPGQAITITTPEGERLEVIAQDVATHRDRFIFHAPTALAQSRQEILVAGKPILQRGAHLREGCVVVQAEDLPGQQVRFAFDCPPEFIIKRNELIHDGRAGPVLPKWNDPVRA